MPTLTDIAGSMHVSGDISAKIPGTQVTGAAGLIHSSGSIDIDVSTPVAAFGDFALFGVSDPDPAQVYVGANNGGTQSGAYGQPYARQFMLVTPPDDYFVSGGKTAWKRAAFASLGFRYTALQAGNWQYLEDIQYEELPLAAIGPTSYSTPRRIQSVIKPTRLNYVTNPSIPAATTGWASASLAGDVTITADTTWARSASHSAKVTFSAYGKRVGAGTALTNLIPGRRYTASAYVVPGAYVGNVRIMLSGRSDRALAGQSYQEATDVTGTARRVWATFTATASTHTLHLGVAAADNVQQVVGGTPQTAVFWFDDVLVEEGSEPRPFFNGDSGYDYLWESSGTPGLSRSYFYEQRKERSYLVKLLIDENTPVGITSADPLFAVPPSQ